MTCERCWIFKEHGYGCETTYFKEFPKMIRLRKLLATMEKALKEEDYEVFNCALERLNEELKEGI